MKLKTGVCHYQTRVLKAETLPLKNFDMSSLSVITQPLDLLLYGKVLKNIFPNKNTDYSRDLNRNLLSKNL